MLAWFERRVDPFPETISSDMPRTFFAFLWECSAGVRPYLLWMTLLTAAIGAFEALLFSMLGRLIDWLLTRHALARRNRDYLERLARLAERRP